MHFEVFVSGAGRAAGAGGRYDELMGRFGRPMPAVGVSLDLDAIAEVPRVSRLRVALAKGRLYRAVGRALPARRRGAGRRCRPAAAHPVERPGDRVPRREAGRRTGLRGVRRGRPRRHRHRRAARDRRRRARAAGAGLRLLPAGGRLAGRGAPYPPLPGGITRSGRHQVPSARAGALRAPPGGRWTSSR